MAFNKAPTELFPGYSSDGTNITIPIADLLGLTAANAHTTTGDWRAIMLALCATAYATYEDLADADKPAAFKPYPPTQAAITAGAMAGSFRQTYQIDFYNVFATPNIADEPAS